MSDCTHRHDHGHVHDHPHRDQKEVGCCGDGTTCSVPIASSSSTGAGRSFRVSGLDCAEEVAILNKAVGPEVGGTDHLAFDVLNGRMIILEGARSIPDDRIVEIVAETGMSADRASGWLTAQARATAPP